MAESESRKTKDALIDQEYRSVLAEFDAMLPTEDACVRYIFEELVSAGEVSCPRCQSFNLGQDETTLRNARCRDCSKKFSFTAGSSLDSCKKPREFLQVMFLWGSGINVTSSRAHKFIDLAQSTIHMHLHALRTVAVDKFSDGCAEVPSESFLCSFSKRSRLTPRDEVPAAEQTEAAREAGIHLQEATLCEPGDVFQQARERARVLLKQSELGERAEAVAIVEAVCRNDYSIDQLCVELSMDPGKVSAVLLLLQLEGIVKQVSASKFALARKPARSPKPHDISVEVRDCVESFLAQARYTFKGVSRKYIQKYLAGHWCFQDRERWQFPDLLKSFLLHPVITYDDILSYDSPLSIRVHPTKQVFTVPAN